MHILTFERCAPFIYRSTMNLKGSLLASGVHRSSTNLPWLFETYSDFWAVRTVYLPINQGFSTHILTFERCAPFIYRSTKDFWHIYSLLFGAHRSSTNLPWIFETYCTIFFGNCLCWQLVPTINLTIYHRFSRYMVLFLGNILFWQVQCTVHWPIYIGFSRHIVLLFLEMDIQGLKWMITSF